MIINARLDLNSQNAKQLMNKIPEIVEYCDITGIEEFRTIDGFNVPTDEIEYFIEEISNMLDEKPDIERYRDGAIERITWEKARFELVFD